MGGYGSGRWGCHRKAATVESVSARLELDSAIAATIRSGGGRYRLTMRVKPSQAGGLTARLGRLQARAYHWVYEVVEGGGAVVIEHGYPERPAHERIAVLTAQLTYGARLFWQCPGCNKRAAILYLRDGGPQPGGFLYLRDSGPQPGGFRCRQCHGLTYRTAQEADKRAYALARNADNLTALAIGGGLVQNVQTLLLIMKAQDILMRRHKRELRKLGVKTDDLPL